MTLTGVGSIALLGSVFISLCRLNKFGDSFYGRRSPCVISAIPLGNNLQDKCVELVPSRFFQVCLDNLRLVNEVREDIDESRIIMFESTSD